MDNQKNQFCTAFLGNRCIASGLIEQVVKTAKTHIERGEKSSLLVFDDASGELVEIDFRGEMKDVLKRLKKSIPNQSTDSSEQISEKKARRGPGRPKLGVIGREVTLLPRHWEWLNSQPGGASVAIRKLVEEARRTYREKDRIRHCQESAYRFISAMAGDLVGFEEATRALFAGNHERFRHHTVSWPEDIRNYACKISKAAFQKVESNSQTSA